MLHNTLSALLVSVASRYAQLSPADVGIGIGGGRLVIDDVNLRAETFNSPRLPFHVHHGRAGRLRVKVPWSALSSSPVEVYLENVHLVAAPKHETDAHSPSDEGNHTKTASSGADEKEKGQWHQTAVGRLAFNVSVEMYGLKVEYRDSACIAVVSIASLRAFSAGRDWNSRFVSLSLDPDTDHTDTTTAVAMRKLVKLSGVHWVMIPRRPEADDPKQSAEEPQKSLDLNSFESKSPILDGIAITLRVLLCTGTAGVEEDPLRLAPGMHAEIEVDLEEPNLNLTARQMKWMDHILQQGFGRGKKIDRRSGQPVDALEENVQAITKRRRRSSTPSDSRDQLPNQNSTEALLSSMEISDNKRLSRDSSTVALPPVSDTESPYLSQSEITTAMDSYADDAVDAEIEKVSDYDGYADDEYGSDEDYVEDNPADIKAAKGGGLRSFWQAIVGENGDETVDDAAIALGLSDGYSTPDEKEGSFEGHEEDHADHLYARNVVEAAAKAGGVTLQLRLKTPDIAAWDLVGALRGDVERDAGLQQRLDEIESLLETAEERVRASEEEAQVLRERNAALMREMGDLERLTGQAGRNKDAMIRQMEAALVKAERNLQAMYQAQFQGLEGPAKVMSPRTEVAVHSELIPDGEAENTEEPESEGLDELNRAVGQEQQLEEDVNAGDRSEKEGFPDLDVEGESDVDVADENGDGDGYFKPPKAEAVMAESSADKDPATQLNASTPPPEVQMARTEPQQSKTKPVPKAAQLGMEEIGLSSPIVDQHLMELNARKLEEAMSSEGLTLI